MYESAVVKGKGKTYRHHFRLDITKKYLNNLCISFVENSIDESKLKKVNQVINNYNQVRYPIFD